MIDQSVTDYNDPVLWCSCLNQNLNGKSKVQLRPGVCKLFKVIMDSFSLTLEETFRYTHPHSMKPQTHTISAYSFTALSKELP